MSGWGFILAGGWGTAEAASKHVIHSRLKRAGMHWSREGAGNPIQLKNPLLESSREPAFTILAELTAKLGCARVVDRGVDGTSGVY